MSAQDEIDAAFTETGAQLKKKVNATGAIKNLFAGPASSIPPVGSRDPNTLYVTVG